VKNSLTFREKQVLIELIQNARISDQQISKKLGTSRPTVMKIRKKLEKNLIVKYLTMVRLTDLDLDVIVCTLLRWDDFSKKKEVDAFCEYIIKNPHVMGFSRGVGLGSMSMIVHSAHKSFPEYELFCHDLQIRGGDNVREVQSFITPSNDMYKKLDPSYALVHVLRGQLEEEKAAKAKHK